MELNLDNILLIGALICFILAALGMLGDKVAIGWVGLALWVATLLTP